MHRPTTSLPRSARATGFTSPAARFDPSGAVVAPDPLFALPAALRRSTCLSAACLFAARSSISRREKALSHERFALPRPPSPRCPGLRSVAPAPVSVACWSWLASPARRGPCCIRRPVANRGTVIGAQAAISPAQHPAHCLSRSVPRVSSNYVGVDSVACAPLSFRSLYLWFVRAQELCVSGLLLSFLFSHAGAVPSRLSVGSFSALP